VLDFRIEGGRIYSGDAPPSPNGVPAPGAVTALGIRAGRLVLDPPEEEPARRAIDASGLAVCPGFIDIHAHSDYAALYAPTALSKVLAGYTTELNGNCGYGAFPLYGRMKQRREDEYGRYGLKIDWEEAEEYLDRCRARPMALNQGLLIGQGTLRGSMVGFDDVRVDRDQRRHMQRYVERAMRLGCFGMSTGLVYAPGSFADRHEIVALAEVVADHDGLYASHLRSESDGVVEALDEFLSVCEQTGCRAEYSHVKTAGRRNWHKLPAVRQRMNDARAADVEVFGDRYPYTASCTDLATILLPNDALAGGGEAIAERLNDPRQRAALKRRITQREQIDGDGADWFERVMIAGVAHSDYTEASGQTQIGRASCRERV